MFVGLFMGLGASFAVLVTVRMMGVKAGLGFYLQWTQGWAAYANMYAALIVMSLLCTTFVSVLFKVRDRVLSYSEGGSEMVTAAAVVAERRSGCVISIAAIEAACQSWMLRSFARVSRQD